MKSKPRKGNGLLILLVLSLFGGICSRGWSANQNPLAIYLDALDDDLRLLTTCLLDASLSERLRLVVVSTGDAKLKTKVVRRIVEGLRPNSKILVVEGTSTDLSANQTTAFAADISDEGAGLVQESERRSASATRKSGSLLDSAEDAFRRQSFQDSPFLEAGDQSGQRSEALSEEAKKALRDTLKSLADGESLDVIMAAAPVDLVSAINADRKLASEKLGNLFAMGLFKVVRDPETNEVAFAIAPFNALADLPFFSTAALLHLYSTEKVFKQFLHLPSDTVRARSGLFGGYPDKMTDFAVELAALREKMESHPVLHLILLAANAYRMHWFEFLGRYGHGLLEGEQWIRDSIDDMTLGGAAGFYIADPALAYLASLDDVALAGLKQEMVKVRATVSPDKEIIFKSPFVQNWRAISDIREIDGPAIVRQHIRAVMAAGEFKAPSNGFDYLAAVEHALDTSVDQPVRYAMAAVASHLSGPLVVVFKNSPDDYFAILTLLGNPAAHQALRRGGIICEGFEPKAVADALRRTLADLGEKQIPVVAGFQYSEAEVAPHRNFGGERVLYGAGAGTAAFRGLAPSATRFPGIQDADELLRAATKNAARIHQRMFLLVLGTGLDIYRHAKHNPDFVRHLRAAYLMQGGRRLDPTKETLEPTRNLKVSPDEIYDGVDLLTSAGVEVDIFSSDVFGSNVSVQLDAAGTAFHGSMRDVYNFMRQTEKGATPTALAAVMRHWRNWGIAYEKPFLIDGKKYDPRYSVDTLKTSLLAVYMSRALVEGKLNLGPVNILVSQVDLRNRMGAGKSATRVNWLNQVQGSVDTDAMATQLLASVVQLEDDRAGLQGDPVRVCAEGILEQYYGGLQDKPGKLATER